MKTYKGYLIEKQIRTQVLYGFAERKANGSDLRKNDYNRKRQTICFIVTEPDGYERSFDRKRDAKEWIDKQ